MRSHHLLSPLWRSFYSRSLYCDVAMNWRGVSFLFLLILCMLLQCRVLFSGYTLSKDFLQLLNTSIIEQLPVIVVKDGIATSEHKMPVWVKNADQNPVVYIDTKNNAKELSDLPQTVAIAVYRDSMYVRNASLSQITNATSNEQDPKKITPPTLQSYPFSAVPDFTMHPEKLPTHMRHAFISVAIVFFILLILFSYAWRLLASVLLALIEYIFSYVVSAHLRYDACLSIAIIAMTPATLIHGALALVDITFPYAQLMYFAITLAYLYFGARANAVPIGTKV